MGIQAFPGWFAAPEQKIETMVVTGASVGATPGSAGLDNRGKFFCTISKSSNTYTVTFLRAYALPPIIMGLIDLTGNVGFDITSLTASQLVFNTTERDDDTASVTSSNFSIAFLTDQSNKAYS